MEAALIFLSSLLPFMGLSQVCLPTQKTTWVNLNYCHPDPPGSGSNINTYSYFQTGIADTSIGGNAYQLLYRDYHKTQYAGAIRSDSSSAYVVPSGESIECTLYTFSTSVGDTLRDILVFNINSGYELLDFYHDTTILGASGPYMELYPIKDTLWRGNQQIWQYGYGSLGSFGVLSAQANINCQTTLACMMVNDTSIYPMQGVYQCGYSNIGLTETVGDELHIYPNPASSVVFVPEELQNKDVEIISATGQTISHKKAGAELQVQHLPHGLYWIRFHGESNLLFEAALLVQH